MTDRHLPHSSYVTAVCDTLTDAGIRLTEQCWTDDGETRGTYCFLNAVMTLDPSGTLTSDAQQGNTDWPHGLVLLWEWHTGIEAASGEPVRGPEWLFAELKPDGSNEYPTPIPVHGYASPDAVVDAVRKIIAREIGAGHFFNGGTPQWEGGTIGGSWDQADALNTACEAWGTAESES
jgi:hypothetical protein